MNSFGRIFRIHIFGESHGKVVGCTLDGVPAGLKISEKDFLPDIQRRKPILKGTTPRKEDDYPILLSGVFNGFTTGAPLTIIFENKNIKSSDYEQFINIPRPGHADFTAKIKFKGFNDYRGGGMFSGRLTLPLVAAGVVAKKIIPNISIKAKIVSVGNFSDIDQAINWAIKNKDSVGGVVECVVSNVPIGLGEPFFDSVESYISHLIFSIPGIKAIEFGAGFKVAQMSGSQYNDVFINEQGKTKTNNSGGINGGITNGNDIVFRVAVKPTSSIPKLQKTYDFKNKRMTTLQIQGRHDVAIILRIPVIIEAAVAIALADLFLINKSFQ